MREFSIIALTMTLLFGPLSADNGSIVVASDPQTYLTQEVSPCSYSSVKTYMSYKAITNKNSTQYKFIQDHLTVDQTTGLLLDEDGFIAVALGSYFGDIGTKYIFTLDSGIELKLVKAESKADVDTVNGCYHASDDSVIEFLIDKPVASEYFGVYSNGLVLSGNFNNHEDFKGRITKIDKVIEDTSRSNVELPF